MAADDFEKVTVRLTKGTKEKLQRLYPSIGYNKVIRILTDNLVRKVDETVSQQPTSKLKVDADIINEVITND